MEAAGLMTDAGSRAASTAQANGWWTIYNPVEDLIEPPELATALDANRPARESWDGFPPSAKKAMLWWIISAARTETQTKRIVTIVSEAEAGRRAMG